MSHANPAQIGGQLAVLASLQRDFDRASQEIESHQRLARRLKGEHPVYKVTKIPEKIYKKDRTEQTDLLSKLPAGVAAQIWQDIPTDADRVMLALTCKAHAETYEFLKMKKINITDNNVEKRVMFLPRPVRYAHNHRLPVLVRLPTWMPANYQLCYKCNQYIDLTHPSSGGTWEGDAREVRNLRADQQATVVGPRCPLCVVADNLKLIKDTPEAKEYERKAKLVKQTF
ncbi:hypothetical protein LTR10_018079 [Elasticomyces elasticus]|uniref:F-box domain-containing protein n=1 Tax=Exophiala sideris TaxID=1016849 RepID=A0ABR0JPJ9_9EURO|nr:hypothetical protein LTR10_018079 [Elasticomyces elasticus]KAK5039518.1 hypothetical protein LTS07_000012 [Exophiala sideris]KAK5041071.1 hypothetical protein LTR13_002545 [Exophiala sideris]KAK5067895.1 hypothetical protein LTR69_000012 [Exophiala sideris]KAK5187197.1 hypothetical protein LTR44_000012 [Eurotiomycetes sp. CCFEE 6388]